MTDCIRIEQDQTELQERYREEAANLRNHVYRICEELKEFADNFMEDVLHEQTSELYHKLEAYETLEQKVCNPV